MEVKPITKEEKKLLELWKRGGYGTFFDLVEKAKPKNLKWYLQMVDPELEYVREKRSLSPDRTLEDIGLELFLERAYEIIKREFEREIEKKKDEILEEVKKALDELGIDYDINEEFVEIYRTDFDAKEVVFFIDNIKLNPCKNDNKTILPLPYFICSALVYWHLTSGIKHISMSLRLRVGKLIKYDCYSLKEKVYLEWNRDTGWKLVE